MDLIAIHALPFIQKQRERESSKFNGQCKMDVCRKVCGKGVEEIVGGNERKRQKFKEGQIPFCSSHLSCRVKNSVGATLPVGTNGNGFHRILNKVCVRFCDLRTEIKGP